jgi:flagellar assembly protein FliH
MHYEGPKRRGRFLKGKSRVLGRVALSEFVFGNLDATLSVTPDNTVRSIIHAKYHEDEELARAVKEPRSFDEDLLPNQHRPVIMPLDFTKDWERNRKLSKDRAAHNYDEDFDLEQTFGTSSAEDLEEPAPENPAAAKQAPASPAAGSPPAPAAQTTGPLAGPLEKAPYASMDAVSTAIKNLRPADQFIPTATPPSATGVTSTAPVSDPEAQAVETYRQRIADQKADEEAAKKAFDEARDRGYQEGYQGGFKEGHAQGEEKAEIAARQHASQLFGKVGELIQEFAGLKHEILDNVQENFYEIAQAMAEALLKREFSIRPEAFVSVLRKAIEEAVEPGKFKIRVHPETFAHVESVAPADIAAALVKDATLEPGDFRIESALSVVDVNIRTMLKDLLDKADISLFGDGDHEKAG